MGPIEAFYGPDIASRANDPLPADYVPYRACKEYFQREMTVMAGAALAGRDGAWGVSWRHGPFRFEKFVSDVEPARDATGPLRLTIWQRLAHRDVPAGWLRGPADMGFRLTGFTALDGERYERSWTAHAKRHASRWRKLVAAGEREIVPLSLDEYLAAYAKADQDALMKIVFPKILREKAFAHGGRLHLVGSRRRGGPIDAGFAFLHVPEAGHSLHIAAFIAGGAKADSAATGLIMRWFEECHAAGLRFLDLGFFWAPGDPRDWRGFSRFKSQFGVRLIRYPRPLFRLSGSFFARRAAT